jgi:LuxR family transcriptional regulator, maltose regulon positive regulatory protein
MQPSFLATKFFFPVVRHAIVHRPLLIELLEGGLQVSRLTLVSAPAGSGKTTLLSEWRAGPGSGTPVGWLSLAREDNDLTRFLNYFTAALDALQPGLAAEVQPLIQTPEVPDAEAVLTFLVNRLSSLDQPSILILDDYHLIEQPAIHKAVIFLLDNLPPCLHLAILTRIDPPFPLPRLRARGQLTEIRANSLRFTLEECSQFLGQVMSLQPAPEQVAALEKRTEGWIAGLQLAAISMQGTKDVNAFVSAFAGSHHYIMDYLVEEVLKLESVDVRAFLLQTSILDRLCEPLCKAVTGNPELPSGILESLMQKNLFIIALDNEQRWCRYHHLFADVLRKRLAQESPQLIGELHRRASRWYEENGLIAEAIQQAIEAGDSERAAKLIEDNGCLLLIAGEVTTLLNWANAIEFQSDIHPWLAIQEAWALALTGNLERVELTLKGPEELLSPLEATDEVKTMQGTIAAARAHCANSRGDSQSAAKYARQALELLPNCSSISQSIRSVTVSILGDASRINGNLEEAIRAYTEAIRIGREANNLNMVIIANSNIADILMEQGQLHRAADIYARSLQIAVRPDGQRSPLAANIFDGLGRLYYEWDRLEDADENIRLCMEQSRIWGDIGQQAYAWSMQARLEQARNDPEKAREAMREAERLIGEHPHSAHWSIQVRADLARVLIAQGNLEGLSQRVQKRGLQIKDDIPYQRESEYVILLRLFVAQGDVESAVILSNRLLRQAETTGQTGLTISTLILQTLALHGKKETEQAMIALERAFALAQPEGYVRSFLDEGETMTRLLCQAQSRQVGNGYASVLLSRVDITSGMAQPSMQLLIEPLTARELEVLQLIKTGCSNQDIADQLVISLPTVKRHISNIYTKLGVESRTQAVAIGNELKLFE